MDKRQVLEDLLDRQLLKVLRLFINNPDQEFYLREIAKRAKVPPASTYRVVQRLLKLELIKEHRVKKFKFYRLHEDAEFLADILADRKSAVQEFVEAIKQDPNITMVVLHGKEERTKANLLIMGTHIDQELIRTAALQAKETYGFNIIHLTLDPDQYNQMSSMGLYPGKKVILYEQ
ncbi:winged helix-turn-helix transcriptional regulator [Candidatus Woesearchaeota archaeon]|nr:winged helix-turn-helix transcriptional regulator [Candidatus Woesearchaeota archaeon]